MGNFFNNLPTSVKILLLSSSIAVLLVAGIFSGDNIKIPPIKQPPVEEIDLKLYVRNSETKEALSSVKVTVVGYGDPDPYSTDVQGYVSIKIPQTSSVEIKLRGCLRSGLS